MLKLLVVGYKSLKFAKGIVQICYPFRLLIFFQLLAEMDALIAKAYAAMDKADEAKAQGKPIENVSH